VRDKGIKRANSQEYEGGAISCLVEERSSQKLQAVPFSCGLRSARAEWRQEQSFAAEPMHRMGKPEEIAEAPVNPRAREALPLMTRISWMLAGLLREEEDAGDNEGCENRRGIKAA
jgi:hypothetical protein